MHSLFIDESGYNGPDLLNKKQPVFALAAICVDEDLAIALKKKWFPELGRAELKHSKLCHDEGSLQKLVGLVEECLNTQYVIAYIIEKRYLACEIFVLDIISRFRPNVRYGSQLFRDFAWILRSPPKEWGSSFGEEIDVMLSQYVKTVSRLLRMKNAPKKVLEKEYKGLTEVLCGLKHPFLTTMCKDALSIKEFEYCLKDSPLSGCAQGALFGLITCIENDIGNDYEIVFDESPSLVEFYPVIENLKTCRPDMVRVSREVTLKMPLTHMKSMRGIDSKISVGVQLADLIAGSAVRAGIYDFGLSLRHCQSKYDESICNLWAKYPRCRIFKPSFDNRGLDISNEVIRVAQAACGQ